MHHHRSIWIIGCVAVVIAVSGCRKNPLHCDGHPDNECDELADAPPIDTPPGCTGDPQCSGSAAVCDLAAATCVQCTSAEATACMGTTPTCGSDDACRACAAHADCPAAACLPDGSCGTDANVAYVDPTGTDNALCTKAMACTKVAKALATGRPFVKFTGTTNEQVAITSQNVTLLADTGAALTRTSNGNILVVDGTSQVEIYDLTVTGASGTGVGLFLPTGNTASLSMHRAQVTNNTGGGISASGGTLTVTQSTISANQGGGISVSGAATFDITNNFIFRNGDQDTGTFGGVDLGIATAGSNRFAFNTVADNRAAINSGGVICNVAALACPNNIVVRNTLAGSANAANAQTSGACTYPTSAVANDASAMAFAHGDSAPFDYHLTSSSAAVDHATTVTTVSVDVDGDARPQGSADDQGADEFKQ